MIVPSFTFSVLLVYVLLCTFFTSIMILSPGLALEANDDKFPLGEVNFFLSTGLLPLTRSASHSVTLYLASLGKKFLSKRPSSGPRSRQKYGVSQPQVHEMRAAFPGHSRAQRPAVRDRR